MVAYYARAHAAIPFARQGPPAGVERALLAAARMGGAPLRMADAYARFCSPTGALRQKLALAMAILENSPETHAALNGSVVGSPPVMLWRLATTGLGFALSLVAGMLCFGPLGLILGRDPVPEAARD
jgi:hypothetical protein